MNRTAVSPTKVSRRQRRGNRQRRKVQSTSMFRKTASALALSASFLIVGMTGNASAQYATQASYNNGMGGGFIEFLFSGPPQPTSPYQQRYQAPQYAPQPYQQQP